MVQLLPTQRSRTTYQHHRKNDMSQKNELPPLPDAWEHFQLNRGWSSWENVIPSAAGEPGVLPAFTADQMRAYARAAIAAHAGQSEPIAWYSEKHRDFMCHETKQAQARLNSYTHQNGEFDKPLFDHPAPVRQRLMDDEIDALWDEPLTLPQKVQRRYIARAVEAKITGATHD